MAIPTDFTPLDTKLSTDERFRRLERAFNALERAHNAHTAEADTAYPGADRRRHYDQHIGIDQREIDKREFWKKVIPQLVGSLALAAIGFLLGAILFFFKFGGA